MLLHPTLHFYIWHKLLVTKTVASMVKRKSSTSCFYVFTLPPLPLCGCVYICERAGQAECVHCTPGPTRRPRPGQESPAQPGRVRRGDISPAVTGARVTPGVWHATVETVTYTLHRDKHCDQKSVKRQSCIEEKTTAVKNCPLFCCLPSKIIRAWDD